MRRINAAGDCAGDSADESEAADEDGDVPSGALGLPLSDADGPLLL